MKFLLRPNGYISSRFANADAYRPYPHEGIDFVSGFRKTQPALADGFVYKVRNKNNPDPQKYRTVYTICDTPLGPMEIIYEHCWDIFVEEGDKILQGQPIITEGNTGEEVYVGGVKVKSIDKFTGKGAHLHGVCRPVDRVKRVSKNEHYLNKLNGKRFNDGNYYQIRYADNGAYGSVDFEQWLFTPTKEQLKVQLSKVLGYLQTLKK